jgi:hypothetical protein
MKSQFLLDFAHGKYNAELALADSALSKIGAVEPWAFIVKQVLDAFVVVNRITSCRTEGAALCWCRSTSP